MTNFLVEVADMVDGICIGATFKTYIVLRSNRQVEYEYKRVQPLPLSLVKEILSRKCSYLHVSDPATKVSTSQVEDIIKVARKLSKIVGNLRFQYFKNKGKKISLAIPSNERSMNIDIDDYTLKMGMKNKHTNKMDLILIEHVNMEFKADDMGPILQYDREIRLSTQNTSVRFPLISLLKF